MPKVILVQAERSGVFKLSFSARFSKALESAICHLRDPPVHIHDPIFLCSAAALSFLPPCPVHSEPSIASLLHFRSVLSSLVASACFRVTLLLSPSIAKRLFCNQYLCNLLPCSSLRALAPPFPPRESCRHGARRSWVLSTPSSVVTIKGFEYLCPVTFPQHTGPWHLHSVSSSFFCGQLTAPKTKSSASKADTLAFRVEEREGGKEGGRERGASVSYPPSRLVPQPFALLDIASLQREHRSDHLRVIHSANSQHYVASSSQTSPATKDASWLPSPSFQICSSSFDP